MYEINWRGDHCKNFYNTRHVPLGFCDHITAGTRQSVYWWFNSPNNKTGSSYYVVCRDGSIDQYVHLDKSAWTQGISGDAYDRAIAPIVRDHKGVNPNYYLIGIEYEGYVEGHEENGETVVVNFGLDGSITEKQFYAGCWLKKYLQGEVEKKWGNRIPLSRYYIEQHRRIDPKRKPNCPGDNFPVERQLIEMALADSMTLESYEEHLQYKLSINSMRADLYAFFERMADLDTKYRGSEYSAEAARKIMLMEPVMYDLGLREESTVESIIKRVSEIKKVAIVDGKWHDEGIRKASIGASYAKQAGIL